MVHLVVSDYPYIWAPALKSHKVRCRPLSKYSPKPLCKKQLINCLVWISFHGILPIELVYLCLSMTFREGILHTNPMPISYGVESQNLLSTERLTFISGIIEEL